MDVSSRLQAPVILSPERAPVFPSISHKTDPWYTVFDGCLLQVLKYVPAIRQDFGVPVFIGLKLRVVVLKVILLSYNTRVASNKITRSVLYCLCVWLYINNCCAVVLSRECYRKPLICSDSGCWFDFILKSV